MILKDVWIQQPEGQTAVDCTVLRAGDSFSKTASLWDLNYDGESVSGQQARASEGQHVIWCLYTHSISFVSYEGITGVKEWSCDQTRGCHVTQAHKLPEVGFVTAKQKHESVYYIQLWLSRTKSSRGLTRGSCVSIHKITCC